LEKRQNERRTSKVQDAAPTIRSQWRQPPRRILEFVYLFVESIRTLFVLEDLKGGNSIEVVEEELSD
jgi:hypothetical protein